MGESWLVVVIIAWSQSSHTRHHIGLHLPKDTYSSQSLHDVRAGRHTKVEPAIISLA